MRYALVDDGPVVYRQINTLAELADVLDKPGPGNDATPWIQGLGSPNCIRDEQQWKLLAKFIREKVISLDPATRPANGGEG